MKHVVVLSGAGISAESGLRTFRDTNGLWEDHRVEDVATPEAFARNPELVLRFYNLRRAQCLAAAPNAGHRLIGALEQHWRVTVITQNVDDLHERGGSTEVIHLHGLLTHVRPVGGGPAREWTGDLNLGHRDEAGEQLRPHIVWFGEEVPMIERAVNEIQTADAVIVIGTSLQVYPAAGLISYAPPEAPVLYVDPNPDGNYELRERKHLHILKMGGSEGMLRVREMLHELL